ncbi:MAG: T9SS type A sorting domain-containing protein [Bacteroidota bacterium]
MSLYLPLLALLLLTTPLAAQDTRGRASELQTAPHPQGLELSWAVPSGTDRVLIYSRADAMASWTEIAELDRNVSSWVDSGYVPGSPVEYQARRFPISGQGVLGTSYVFGGDELPAVHSHGSVVIVVEDRLQTVLQPQIDTLLRDLRGEGWQTHLVSANASDAVTDVRADIVAINDQVGNVNAIYLIGHVPVPYSGNMNPDGHLDHRGAWPADVYYGCWSMNWTDNLVDYTQAARPANHNAPGDGKFDQNTLTLPPDAAVGRVDFSNLPNFSESDTVLIQNYLRKAHRWRTRQYTMPMRALIEDNFGDFGGEAFAANGYRNFTALVHRDSVREDDFRTTLQDTPYLLSYGTGGGTYTSAGGIINSNQLASDNLQTVFSFLFGSYFGDWDTESNLLRSMIAQGDYTLVSGWPGRPNWFVHGLGVGEPIGHSLTRTQANTNTYQQTNSSTRGTHIALMGDPTIRALYEMPVPEMSLATDTLEILLEGEASDGIIESREAPIISWTATADADGYFVYRKASTEEGWSLLNAIPTSALSITDSAAITGEVNQYMVRSAKWRRTPSAGFLNLGTGIMDSISLAPADTLIVGSTAEASALSDLKIYPNPVAELLSIQSTGLMGQSIRLESLTGQRLLVRKASGTHERLDISALPAGVYILRVGSLARRIVKE